MELPVVLSDNLQLTIKINHSSHTFLESFKTRTCKISKLIWTSISNGIKETLDNHYDLNVEVRLEGWLPGVIIELSIDNINVTNLQDIKKLVYDQVVLILPSCDVQITIPVIEIDPKSKLDIVLQMKTCQEISSTLLNKVVEIARDESENFIRDLSMGQRYQQQLSGTSFDKGQTGMYYFNPISHGLYSTLISHGGVAKMPYPNKI